MSVVKATVDRYTIRAGSEWAKVFLESGVDGSYHWGDLSIVSSLGNYGHHWGSIGEKSFEQFLASLDSDYALKKITNYAHEEFDFDATIAAIRARIIRRRKEDRHLGIPREAAREIWDGIEAIETEGQMGEGVFCEKVSSTIGAPWWDYGFWEDGVEKRVRNDCAGLWKYIWPELIAAIAPKVPA